MTEFFSTSDQKEAPIREDVPTNLQTESEDDFYRQVLGSFKKPEFTPEEIEEKQQNWKKYEESEPEKVQHHDFPDYFFAGFWIRFWAFLIDILCINAVTGITIKLFFRLFDWSITGGLFSAYGLLSLIVYLTYFTLLTKMNHGQTIGKMIFGIRVICFNEEELSWQTVLIREVAGRFILRANPFLYLGYLPTVFTKKKQHVGDYFADTSVVTLNLIQAFNKQAQI